MPSFATLLRAPNPGPMTLDGTNTWVLRARPGLPAVVVDPGPADEGHLAAIVAAGPIGAIIVTHRHLDHVEGITRLRDLLAAAGAAAQAADRAPLTAAERAVSPAPLAAAPVPSAASDEDSTPVRAAAGAQVSRTGDPNSAPAGGGSSRADGSDSDPVHAAADAQVSRTGDPGSAPVGAELVGDQQGSRPVPVYAADPVHAVGTEPLRDGDRLALAGLDIEIVAAPGHTADSVCLLVSDAAGERVVFTGDTILGRGTAVIAWPDGDLGDYLATLDRLSAYRRIPVLPGHGPQLPDCGEIAREYRAHRDDRIGQVRGALAAGARTPADVVAHVYPDLEPALVSAAEWTVRAALAYLHAPSGNSP